MHTRTTAPALLLLLAAACLTAGCASSKKGKRAPDNYGFCPTYSYEGYYVTDDGSRQNITINMMRLLDSSLICSYHNDETPSVVYRMGGRLNSDLTFAIGEFVNDSVAFVWSGTQSADGKQLQGRRRELATGIEHNFYVEVVFGKSYWDYIHKNRGYEEYTDLKTAIRHCHDVLSIDVARQGLTHLPSKLACLDRIESINLLGNHIDTFPPVLAELTTLDEISLSSNGLKYIGPEIGKLKNLRILILNFNKLTSLPKEIGELTNLMYLDVSTNPKLNDLPEEIKNLTKLQELHIETRQPSSERFTDEQKRQFQEWLPNCKIHFDLNK